MTSSGPPLVLIIAAIAATLAVAAFVVFVLYRSIRREGRGFEVKPTTSQSRDDREHQRTQETTPPIPHPAPSANNPRP
jgi:hypothetical protein